MNTDPLEIAREVLSVEAAAILQVSGRLNTEFNRAVEILLAHQGKTILTGVGKSAHIAQKVTATLSSLGTPAVFMHASDAFHGDLGVVAVGDPVILFSKSGTTAEVMKLVTILRNMHCPLIAVVGNSQSPLAYQVDIVIDVTVNREADPNNLAPTASTTAALAVGDALACTLAAYRNFTPEDFARYHPGGQLGKNLRLRVQDVAHVHDQVAWVHPETSLKEIVVAMTRHPLGAACVVDEQHYLHGIITDGDLRRALTTHDDIRQLRALDIMTGNPTTVAVDALCSEALVLMENRPSQISVLPVMRDASCIGLLRIHDIYSGDGLG